MVVQSSCFAPIFLLSGLFDCRGTSCHCPFFFSHEICFAMAAHLSATTVGHGATMGSGVLTIACVTSIATCLDFWSTIGPPPVVARTGSSVASLVGLPILSSTDLNSNFKDRISRFRDVIWDSFVVSSSKDSCRPPPV
ncbi:hypothetical protein R1flu_019483 [Riccia fluitans]|uniref:Secreted protein n=1 Tax=Riccia fluitans TaxID=41844 RepID=A0ABD1ZJ44_9MARC